MAVKQPTVMLPTPLNPSPSTCGNPAAHNRNISPSRSLTVAEVRQRIGDAFEAFYHRFGLRQIGPIAMLVAYSFIGAAIFQYLEQATSKEGIQQFWNESRRRQQEFAQNLAITTSEKCGGNKTVSESQNCLHELFLGAIAEHEKLLNLHDTDQKYDWDFWDAMFFAGTLYTTIGYGHMFCKTLAGQITTIIYSCLGIPLVLLILSDLGKMFHIWMKRGWNELLWRTRRFKQKKPAKEVPLLVAFIILFLYTFLCAAIFKLWETNMDYFTAFYFFFISLSTIGLGDVVPEHPRYTVIGFGLILIGLALVSMCINIIQAKFEHAYETAVEALLKQLEVVSHLHLQGLQHSDSSGHHDSSSADLPAGHRDSSSSSTITTMTYVSDHTESHTARQHSLHGHHLNLVSSLHHLRDHLKKRHRHLHIN